VIDPRDHAREWVAIILAFGFVLALNMITAAVLYDALFSRLAGLSENATQILTAGFGAIAGLLGAYLGARGVNASRDAAAAEADEADLSKPRSDPA
jgi:hypothetical protein